MSLSTIQHIQTEVETIGATISDLKVINNTFNNRVMDPPVGSFMRYTVFDAEQQIGSITGAGVTADVEKGNLIIEFFDAIDKGQRLYTMADTFRSGLKAQFDGIKFKIFRIENIGVIERNRGAKGGTVRNGLHKSKGLYKIELRATFEKYFL